MLYCKWDFGVVPNFISSWTCVERKVHASKIRLRLVIPKDKFCTRPCHDHPRGVSGSVDSTHLARIFRKNILPLFVTENPIFQNVVDFQMQSWESSKFQITFYLMGA